jgi:glycosyltransferase involved in cell wall biosynthesis
VGHYTQHLAAAFGGLGQSARVVTQLANGLWYVVGCNQMAAQPLSTVVRQLAKATPQMQLFWQYTPYNFSRIGVPLYLPWRMFRFRLSGYRQAIFFHEVSVRFWGYGFRQALLALGQRLVANAMAAICAQSFTSIGLYGSYFWGKKPWVVPVGANIMPAPKAAIPLLPPVELACFANRADEALFVALAAIDRGQPCSMVLLGNLDQRQQERIEACLHRYQLQALVTITGTLPEAELSRYLKAAQIFIQPQKVERGSQGGASGKNGTLIAAMGMGKAIITTKGDMTDPHIFRDGENLLFVPYGDAIAYGGALEQLQDAANRTALGLAAQASFEQYFAWPVIAGQIIEVLNRKANV